MRYTHFLHSKGGGCMERVAIAMQDGGAGAGARAASQPHFVLPPNLYNEPPRRGGLFGFRFSSRPHPRKFGVKRFLVLREVLAGKWGGLFLGYLLGKNFRRRDRDHLVPPR